MPTRTSPEASLRLWTPSFLVLMLAGFANFFSQGVVAPLLPRYVKDELGGSDLVVGVVVALIAVSAIIARPSAAAISNRRGRRLLVVSGAAISGTSILLYAVAPSLVVLVPARLLTGVGQALYFTGAATMVTELAPDSRRGEAVSFFSVSVYLGAGLGPALGESIQQASSIAWGFVAAGVIGLTGSVVGLRTRETLDPDDRETDGVRFSISTAALAPGLVLALGMLGSVGFAAFMPLYADELGLDGAQWVFLVYALTVIVVRIFGARLPDVLGPARSGTLATVIIAIGLGCIAVVHRPIGLYAGTVVFALGISFHYPSLMTLVVNRATARERSAVVATFTAFFDVATGLGGLLMGSAATVGGYRAAFATGAVSALVALVLLRLVVLAPGRDATVADGGSGPLPVLRDP